MTIALLVQRPARPDDRLLHSALFGWSFNAAERQAAQPTREISETVQRIRRACRPVSALRDLSVVRAVLDALTLRQDGRPTAAKTIYRKCGVFYNALGLAVERRLLSVDPVDQVQWRAPVMAKAVDRRVVASPVPVRELLDAAARQPRRGGQLVASFGCLYLAGMRPSEALGIRESDCTLPESG